jgi:hypothetical protein
MIERGNYEAQTFKDELFVMVRQLTDEVIFGKH